MRNDLCSRPASALLRGLLPCLVVIIAGWQMAHAQTVTTVELYFVPLYQTTAALQFDVRYPGNVHILAVNPGFAATAVDKLLYSADLPGSKRILILGVNQNMIGSGVIASLSIQLDPGFDPASNPVVIQNVAAADPAGSSAPVSGGSGLVVSIPAVTIPQPSLCGVQANSNIFVDAAAQTLNFGGCALPAIGNAGWLSAGFAASNLSVNVAANNTGRSRTGTLSFGATSVTVTQWQTFSVFADVPPSHDFFDAINLMWSRSITAGCSAAPLSYCPDRNLTRGEMAVFMVRAAMGGDNFTYSAAPYFVDVPASHAFFRWVQKMKELGITVGCDPTHYCPDDLVTRGQMAAFIIRSRYGLLTEYNPPAAPYFTDVEPGSPFYEPIQKMRQVGITTGCSPTTYCRDWPTTRGQVAVFVMRGEFNQLLPANTPVVTSISPAGGGAGQSVNVTITGRNTNFNGATRINAGAGVTVSGITVVDGSTIFAVLQVAGDAMPGPRSLIVETGSEEAVLPNGFRVQ